jgi:acyl-CoA synthetase (AMP-forming)/AMP-acid ligase II
VSADEVKAYLSDKIAKWWMPDAVEFIDAIPHTATGKILKTELRDKFKDYKIDT